jgi:hypothetical protein
MNNATIKKRPTGMTIRRLVNIARMVDELNESYNAFDGKTFAQLLHIYNAVVNEYSEQIKSRLIVSYMEDFYWAEQYPQQAQVIADDKYNAQHKGVIKL